MRGLASFAPRAMKRSSDKPSFQRACPLNRPHLSSNHLPHVFTEDEIATAYLLLTEGTSYCVPSREKRDKEYRYYYPRIAISMCDREALEPASRVFGLPIGEDHRKKISCDPQIYPHPKTLYHTVATGTRAVRIVERLKPLLTTAFLKKWERTLKKCGKESLFKTVV